MRKARAYSAEDYSDIRRRVPEHVRIYTQIVPEIGRMRQPVRFSGNETILLVA